MTESKFIDVSIHYVTSELFSERLESPSNAPILRASLASGDHAARHMIRFIGDKLPIWKQFKIAEQMPDRKLKLFVKAKDCMSRGR